MNRCSILFALLALQFVCGLVRADTAELAGSVEAEVDGQRIVFSALSLNYDLEVRGDLLNVKLTQTFVNPVGKPVNARYLFPLHQSAAVHAMTMRVGDEVVQAEIQKKQVAQATFKKAKAAGKAASLLTQARPNMFTQKIANLMPGLPLSVVIEYSQIVPKVDGAFELVVPMVVGPRFQPPGAGVESQDSAAQNTGVWQLEALPAYPQTAGVHIPTTVARERVSLHIALENPLPLGAIHSATHKLSIRHVSSTQAEITFAQGREIDNRDFVLRYAIDTPKADAGLLSHWQQDEGGYFSLLIEPPQTVQTGAILPREMVFLLDCSGSMSGLPMQASKRFMSQALQRLRPADTFRIIRFSDSATEFSQQPLRATPANITRGLSYAANLYGSGGTMMSEGIRQALSGAIPEGRIRNVVFLTDGYIGNEVSVLSQVEALRGEARLFAFGVGSGVNRYLMEELGRTGRGFTRYFDPTRDDETMEAVTNDLVARLQTPVLKDLVVDWGSLPVRDVLPAELPDLYAGNSIRVVGRFTEPAQGEVKISGTGAQSSAELQHQVTLDENSPRPVLRQIWARTAVADLNQQFLMPVERRGGQLSNENLQNAITDLGLAYDLVTRWTSFVAVSRRVYNLNPADAVDAEVPLPKVKGVSKQAYATGTIGHAAPEPGTWLSLLLGLSLLAWLHRRRVTT